MCNGDELHEKDVIIDNLKEYLLILEFNDSKKNEEIISLKNEILQLKNEILQLKNENDSLRAENEHFKSTKAYKLWRKYKRD